MKSLRTSLSLLATMTFLLGVVYPSTVWVLGQTLFHNEANGSLLFEKGQVIGSALIGQAFTSTKYFWSRPSSTQGGPYQFFGSGASQLSPNNTFLIESVRAHASNFQRSLKDKVPVPAEMVTSSGSGLDPHISPVAARLQAGRVAATRALPLSDVLSIIDAHAQKQTFGFIGEPRVNVLQLNLALDHSLAGQR